MLPVMTHGALWSAAPPGQLVQPAASRAQQRSGRFARTAAPTFENHRAARPDDFDNAQMHR